MSRSRVFLSALLLVLAAVAVYYVLDAPHREFNGQRLLPSFLLARGMVLYPEPHEGPLLSTMYGPVTTLVYLPATIFHEPVAAILAGTAWTVLLSLGAILWLHLRQTPRHMEVALLAFAASGLMVCVLESTNYSCLRIHADAPALFFAMLAVGATSLCGRKGMALAGVCSALAVWAKQPLVGVAAGLAMYYGVDLGWRGAVRFGAWASGAAGVLAAIFGALWGWKAMVFNLLTVPAHHPWKHASKLLELAYSTRTMLQMDLVILVPLAGVVMLGLSGGAAAARERMRGQLWAAALLTGVCLTPLSIVSFSKVAGDVNNLSFATLFLLLGLVLLLQHLAVDSGVAARGAWMLLAGVALISAATELPLLARIPANAHRLGETQQAQVFRYMQEHPGRGYFPWFPLAEMESSGRVYQGAYGLWNHVAGGYPPTAAEFRRYVPRDADFVAFTRMEGPWVSGLNFMSFLPEYECVTKDEELPELTLYATRASMVRQGRPCVLIAPENPEGDGEPGGN